MSRRTDSSGWLLDTNGVTAFSHGQEPLTARVLAIPPDQLFVSDIVIEELVRGRLAVIHSQRERTGIVRAYEQLWTMLDLLHSLRRAPYDDPAQAVFRGFPAETRRISIQDRRIAATAISQNLVVTSNTRDFSRIPGVRHEDWMVVPDEP